MNNYQLNGGVVFKNNPFLKSNLQMQTFSFYDIKEDVSRFVNYPFDNLLDIHMSRCVQSSPLIAATEKELAAVKYILLVSFCNHDENVLNDMVCMKKHGFQVGKRFFMVKNPKAVINL